MSRIAFYISGHGLGHAMRMKELMRCLLHEDPRVEIFVMGTMPSWVYDEPPALRVHQRFLRCDVGAIQKDSLHLDVRCTLEENAEFYRGIDALVKREAGFIRAEEIDIVVGDIPPLAFLVSSSAGVTGIAIGNFSWDWIYEEYAAAHPHYAYLVDMVRDAYARADLLLRLPFHGDMSAFRTILDIPLIARRGVAAKEEVRSLLGIRADEARKVVFISMGGHVRAEIGEEAAGDFGDYIYISYFTPAGKMENLILLENKSRIPHPDLVRASDLVISKPGYCTVAECIANQTPLMYTSRDRFREFPVMESAVRKFCRWYYLPREDFHAGAWRKHLDAFFSLPGTPWPDIPPDGATVAARQILNPPDTIRNYSNIR